MDPTRDDTWPIFGNGEARRLGIKDWVRRRGPKVLTVKVEVRVGRETAWRVSVGLGGMIPVCGVNQGWNGEWGEVPAMLRRRSTGS